MNFFSKICAFYALGMGSAMAMITAPVVTPDVTTAADSCVIDMSALADQIAASGASDDTNFVMKDASGQVFIDTSKIPAAIREFERTTCWERLSPRTRLAVKVAILTLAAVAASFTGYITGADFVTYALGYATGEVKARLLRASPIWVRLLFGGSMLLSSGLFGRFVYRYQYGADAVDETVFMVRTIFDWFSSMTGRWTLAGEMYAGVKNSGCTEMVDLEFGALQDELRRARQPNLPFISAASVASASTMNLG